jgi:hypothetical protein
MTNDTKHMMHLNPVDLSLKAALQLEELRRGDRKEAPALIDLLKLIRTPAQSYGGEGVSMLDDRRAYTLLRDTVKPSLSAKTHQEFSRRVDEYLSTLEAGVLALNADVIADAKRFCLALNRQLLAKQLNEIYDRYEPELGSRSLDEQNLPQL